ncbi:PREDICTED: putative receptor-like protein kinase At5g39000 [Erythranthe guttata]|uniref:putative receptor-like protein kinase At5g39000 n=1 Tax=Erythranthe guttata TaxID=4155 RepID=UPI00064DE332|nr:PREDICTED: putative receptor-like protein kinase At5g39000 [Erythranthe guttata]|eukprot:XP_012832714.1 PREDICTED: putative receptor-like protein kinase At5g39000 [Erythranthe guttata]
MILVYEYMSCGTLADHIYNARENGSTSSSSFTWKQRLDICIGVGRGLDYLHTGNGIIHRDVKTSDILLDENFTAKVSDFGLAKLENKSKLHSHVSTEVKGTRGYLDPNYYHTNKLRKESDTYAFGVVLLEVLCGRPAVDSMAAENEQLLTVWARDKINKGEVDQIVATNLKEEISPNSLKTFVRVVERCLLDEPNERPPMSKVVSGLELAAEQQEIKQPFEIVANISDDDNHIVLIMIKMAPSTVQTEQTTIFSTAVQYSTPPPNEQTNNNVVFAQLPHNDKDEPPVQTGQPLSGMYKFDNSEKKKP